LEGLIKLAVPSELLHGDSYKKLLANFDEEPGFVFSSSGSASSITVRVYGKYVELTQ
jgi:hypothetical protein